MKRPFAATVWREGKWYVSQCLELDIASQGETEEEATQTMDFIRRNSVAINSICTGTFLLEKYSIVAEDPQRTQGMVQVR